MATGASAAIPTYPTARAAGCPFDPPPELRARAPVTRVRLWDGSTPWLVTGYTDARALLSDPRISSDITLAGYPHVSPGARARRTRAQTFISMDDPDHARLRCMVTGTFAIKRVEALRP